MRLIAILLVAAFAYADEIHLASGEIIDGEVLSEDAQSVRVRIVQGGMTAERTWQRSEIASIVRGESRRQREAAAVRAAIAELGLDAPPAARTALAQRAKNAGDATLARTLAEQAVAGDPNQVDAQRLLGREQLAGVWMRPHEAAAARGMVWHDGRWLTWDEREKRRTEEREQLERQRAALTAAMERRRQAAEVVDVGTYQLPLRWSYPARTVWWGGSWQQPYPNYPPPCYNGNIPYSSVNLSGGWGNVDWRIRLTW